MKSLISLRIGRTLIFVLTFNLLLLLILPHTRAVAAELKGVTMPDQENLDSKKLLLNGQGIREVSVLGIVVRVYVAGLYLEKKSDDENEILKASIPKKVRLEFLHKVSGHDMKKNWEKGINASCEEKCGEIKSSLEKYKDLLPDVKSGDKMLYTFDSKGLEILFNDKKLGKIDDPLFAKFVLATWIGKNPVTPELKRGMLTNKN